MLRIDFGFFSVRGVWRAVLGVVGETSFLYFGCDEDVLRCANPVVMPLVSSLDIAGDDNYACTGHTLEFEGNSVVLGSNATATTKGGTIIPLPKPEVRVVAMEVTQGLQNWKNTVTLVKNRRTAVRVFMETTAMRRKITAELKGSKVADSVKTEFDDSPRPPTNYERKVEVRSNVTERRGYEDCDLPSGEAINIGGSAAVWYTGGENDGTEIRSQTAAYRNVGGHELGHILNQKHPIRVRDESNRNNNGSYRGEYGEVSNAKDTYRYFYKIGQEGRYTEKDKGWRNRPTTIYNQGRWIDIFHYEDIVDLLSLPLFERYGTDDVSIVSSELFSGSIAFSGGDNIVDVELDSVFSGSSYLKPDEAGEFILELRDEDGTIVRSIPFSVQDYPYQNESEDVQEAIFSVVVADPPEYSSFAITRGGHEIDVFANDIDLENDAKLETLSIYAQPVLGTAKIVVAPSGLPVVEYIASNQGVDVFSYEMCDYGDRCDTAQVRVAVSEDTILGTTLDDTIY